MRAKSYVERVAQFPAQDVAWMLVEHGRETEKALSNGDMGGIRTLYLIGGRSGALAQQVRAGGHDLPWHGQPGVRVDRHVAHQAHPIFIDQVACWVQVVVQATYALEIMARKLLIK